jgi:hypothetical protein
MDAIVSEIANRALLYTEIILNELVEKDKGEEQLSPEDSRLREFISVQGRVIVPRPVPGA